MHSFVEIRCFVDPEKCPRTDLMKSEMNLSGVFYYYTYGICDWECQTREKCANAFTVPVTWPGGLVSVFPRNDLSVKPFCMAGRYLNSQYQSY